MRFILLTIIFLNMNLAYAADKPSCEVLTLQDVETTLGSGFKYITGPDSDDYTTCLYRRGLNDVASIVILNPGMDAAEALKVRQGMQEQAGIDVIPVSELGEGAFYSINNNQLILIFGKGSWTVDLTLKVGGKPDVESAKKLAATVLSRLP